MWHKPKGQALAEFALIIIVLLMLIFVIIETSRILWAWVTVQNAAREGARYAITGRASCGSDRLICVINATKQTLQTLPLAAPNSPYETDNYYQIEVYTTDENGYWDTSQMSAGTAGTPVMVRAVYRVPIVTPMLRPIVSSLVLYGQVIMNNEQFDYLGGSSAGVGLPPPISGPPPTVGPTPTPTPPPTDTPTSTPGPSPTPTSSITPIPCQTQFDGTLFHGTTFAGVTGNRAGDSIIIYDLNASSVPVVIATSTLQNISGHTCPAYRFVIPVVPPLVGGHALEVRNGNDNTRATAIVATPPALETATPTFTPTRTPPPATATPTPTRTPATPFIIANPSCSQGSPIQFMVEGYNWTNTSAINLYWIPQGQAASLQDIIPAGHPPAFQRFWSLNGVPNGTHTIRAQQGATISNFSFVVPCPNVTATPPTVTATATPNPADLIIGQPILISTPPIVEYQPIDIRVVITNTGSVNVNNQFFVDSFFDPPVSAIYSDTIDILYSSGYRGITTLAGGQSRVITITAPLGFVGGDTGTREIYTVVDSILQIPESNEYNNISQALQVGNVTPAPSPTPVPTLPGSDRISGIVSAYISTWVPQYRAHVYLVAGSNIYTVDTAQSGYYEFNGVSPGTYNLVACIDIDTTTYVGALTGIVPPNPFADIWMLSDPAGCPYGP